MGGVFSSEDDSNNPHAPIHNSTDDNSQAQTRSRTNSREPSIPSAIHSPTSPTSAGFQSFRSMMPKNVERLRSNSEGSGDTPSASMNPSFSNNTHTNTTNNLYTDPSSPVRSIGDPTSDAVGSLSPLSTAGESILTLQTPLRDINNNDWWMPDNACKECYQCQDRFHFFFRRHHCRLCGLIFCYRCSNHFVYGHEFGFKQNELVRCCDDCHAVLPTLQNNTGTARSRRNGLNRNQLNGRHTNQRSTRRGNGNGNQSARSNKNSKRNKGARRGLDLSNDGSSTFGNNSRNNNNNNRTSGLGSGLGSGKIARTGTKGINARYDGQTYDSNVSGHDLEFDDLHHSDDNNETRTVDGDTPERKRRGSHRSMNGSRRRRSHGKNSKRRDSKSNVSGFGDDYFPTQPSGSDDSGNGDNRDGEDQDEDDYFVTGEILSELTKSPRLGAAHHTAKAQQKRENKQRRNTTRAGGQNGVRRKPNSAKKASKNTDANGNSINASSLGRNGRSGSGSGKNRGRSISMRPDGYRDRVLSSMSQSNMASSSSSLFRRETAGSLGGIENGNDGEHPFTLFAALKRANQEAGTSSSSPPSSSSSLSSFTTASKATIKTTESNGPSHGRRHRSMEDNLLQRKLDEIDPENQQQQNTPSSKTSSVSSSPTQKTNKTLSPVLEGADLSNASTTRHKLPKTKLTPSTTDSVTATWDGSVASSHHTYQQQQHQQHQQSGPDDGTLSALQLRMLQISTSDHLKRDILRSLSPIITHLLEDSNFKTDTTAATTTTLTTDPKPIPPQLDTHILVRKVLSLVRQAMVVASYPSGDDIPTTTMDGRHPELCYDILQFVKVKPIPGGNVLRDSRFVHGVVFNKNVADRGMRTEIRSPRIVLVSEGIEWRHRAGGGIVSIETVRDQEKKYIKIMVAKIASLRPDILITSGAVSSFAINMFKGALPFNNNNNNPLFLRCAVLRNVDSTTLKAIARFTNATILNNAHVASHFSPEDVIGTCGSFRVQKHANQPFVYLEEKGGHEFGGHEFGTASRQSINDSMMKRDLEGSVGTVLIHTGSTTVDKTIGTVLRRLVRSSIAAAYSLSMESHYLNDIYGALPLDKDERNNNNANGTSPGGGGSNGNNKSNGSNGNNGNIGNNGNSPTSNGNNNLKHASDSTGRPHSTSGIQRIHTVPVKRPSNAGSGSAPSWVTRPVVVAPEDNQQLTDGTSASAASISSSVSKRQNIQQNNSNDSNNNKNHHTTPNGKKNIRSTMPMESPFDTNRMDNASNTNNSNMPTNTRMLHDAFGRSKEVSFACCWRHPEEHRQCCPPTEVNIRFYSMDDRPLGLWMRQQCFNYDLPCTSRSKCKRRAIEHRLAYTRPEGQLSIRTEIMEMEDVEHIRSRRAEQIGRSKGMNDMNDMNGDVQDVENDDDEEEDVLDPSHIYTWGFCKICREIVTPVNALSRPTLSMSFGRFLETWFFNDVATCRDGECKHRLHRDHIRFFGRFDRHGRVGLSARFEFDEIKVFSVSIPGVRNGDDSTIESRTTVDQQGNSSSSSTLRPRLEPALEHVLVNGMNNGVKEEVQFLRGAASVLFQVFQERMRGFLMERLIRGCLQRGDHSFRGERTKESMRVVQETYTRLRSGWWDVWNTMIEEQEALSLLLGMTAIRGVPSKAVVGSPGTAKEAEYRSSMWTSKGVTVIELYSLRKRLIQMVDAWNGWMMEMYTHVITVAYNGEWIEYGGLEHEIDYGMVKNNMKQDLNSNSTENVKETPEVPPLPNQKLQEGELSPTVEAVNNELDELYGRRRSTSSSSSSSVLSNGETPGTSSSKANHNNNNNNNNTSNNSSNSNNNSSNSNNRSGTRSRARSGSRSRNASPIPIPERIVREGTPTQPVTPLSIAERRPSFISSTTNPPPRIATVAADSDNHQTNPLNQSSNTFSGREGVLENNIRSGKASPVVRSSTLTPSTNSGSGHIIRSSTIETTGGSILSKYRSERLRLLNAGPLGRYAYSSLFDAFEDSGNGGTQGLVGFEALLESLNGADTNAVGTFRQDSMETNKNTIQQHLNQVNNSNANSNAYSNHSTHSTDSSNRSKSAPNNNVNANAKGNSDSNSTSNANPQQAIPTTAALNTSSTIRVVSTMPIDPRAYALSVPMDMFPKLSSRHLRLQPGHRGSIVPIDWPRTGAVNPFSVVAKSISTNDYIDQLRNAIEQTRITHRRREERKQREDTNSRRVAGNNNKGSGSGNTNSSDGNRNSNGIRRKDPRATTSTSTTSVSSSTTTTTPFMKQKNKTSTQNLSHSGDLDPGLFGLFGAESNNGKGKGNTNNGKGAKPLHLSDLLVATTPERHLKLNFSDDESDFTCTVPCATNFYALRRTYCKRAEKNNFENESKTGTTKTSTTSTTTKTTKSNESNKKTFSSSSSSSAFSVNQQEDELFGSYTPVFEEDYIQSLCQSDLWDASGGKSGATFCRTNDGRFILKRIRKVEYDMFVSSSLKYFSYMREALYEDMPTMLVKILGIHAIKVQHKRTRSTMMSHQKSSSVMSVDMNDRAMSQQHQATPIDASIGGGVGLGSGASVLSNSSDANAAAADTTSGTTIYVIVQENLFHAGGRSEKDWLKPPTTIFDLKGVLRFRRKSVVVGGGRSVNSSRALSSSASSASSASTDSTSRKGTGSAKEDSNNSGKDINNSGHAYNSNTVNDNDSETTFGGAGGTGNAGGQEIKSTGVDVLVDGDFLQCTRGLPVPLYHRDRALLDCASRNDTLFLSTMNVVDYSLLVGVRDDNNVMTAGIIDYLHPYNFIKRAENLFKDGLHDLHLRSAESTIQKASEYKRRFRAATELYFMALPSEM